MKGIKYKYIISFGIKDNIIVAIVALLFDTAAYFMYRQGTAVFIPFAVFGGFVTVLFLISLYRTLFNKICIYDDYFIHTKSPFKDVIINDYEVDDAWINQRKNAKGTVGCYFNYVTKDGRKANFLYRLQNMILPIIWLKDCKATMFTIMNSTLMRNTA